MLVWYRFEDGDIATIGGETKLANWASGTKIFDSTVFGTPVITNFVKHNGYTYTTKFKAFVEGASAINFPKGNCAWGRNRYKDACGDAVHHYIQMPSITILPTKAVTMMFWWRAGEYLGPVCYSGHYDAYPRSTCSGGPGAAYSENYVYNAGGGSCPKGSFCEGGPLSASKLYAF